MRAPKSGRCAPSRVLHCVLSGCTPVGAAGKDQRVGASDTRRVVYSSESGRIDYCDTCGQPKASCRCHADRLSAAQSRYPQDGVVRLARDKKGRGGKVVTLVVGVPGSEAELAKLAQDLKRFCGSGGTVRDGVIELQGEHRDKLEPKLRSLGYTVKRAGG